MWFSDGRRARERGGEKRPKGQEWQRCKLEALGDAAVRSWSVAEPGDSRRSAMCGKEKDVVYFEPSFHLIGESSTGIKESDTGSTEAGLGEIGSQTRAELTNKDRVRGL